MADTKQTKDFREIVYSDLDKLIQLQAFSNQETNSKELQNILQDHDTRRKDWFKDHRMSPQFNNIGNIQNKELFKFMLAEDKANLNAHSLNKKESVSV